MTSVSRQGLGVPASPSGSRPSDGAEQVVSTADAASIPNAFGRPVLTPSTTDELIVGALDNVHYETERLRSLLGKLLAERDARIAVLEKELVAVREQIVEIWHGGDFDELYQALGMTCAEYVAWVASGMSAGTAETPQIGSGPKDRQPGPKGTPKTSRGSHHD